MARACSGVLGRYSVTIEVEDPVDDPEVVSAGVAVCVSNNADS
ncbi:MAG: hypothetical protein SangKO_027690 [Sandaracinaceae bacterium]